MKRNLLLILALIAIGYSSCKQSLYKAPAPAAATSFLPQTEGTTWVYRDSTFGEITDPAAIYGVHYDTLNYVMNGATTDFNGMIGYDVKVLSHDNTIATNDFCVGHHVYEAIENTAAFGITTLQVLNDTASVGYTWCSNPSISGLLHNNPVRALNTIAEKNITKTVNGKIYTNVTHTSINYQVNIDNSTFNNVAHFDVYLAKGIGIIEKDSYYYGYLNQTHTLVQAVIK